MGFFKKIFRPVSKVLDKVVPNEIKPLLPYAAAFAPYLLPPGAGGIFSGIGINNPMLQRAIMTGGLNIGSQLAQEGNEGEINALSAGLAALQGGLTAPGAADTLSNMKISGRAADGTLMRAGEFSGLDLADQTAAGLTSDIGMLGKAQNFGLDALTKGANLAEKASNTLSNPGFNMDTLKAAALPISQGTGDVMYAENTRAMKDYEQALADYEATMGEGATDEGRALAIRAAMEAGQHSEDIIIETLQSLGLYAHGGRVRAMGGGLMNAKRGLVDAPGGYAGITEIENMREFRIANPNIEDVADYKGYYDRKNNPEKYDEDGFEIKEEIKEKFTAPDFGGITEAVGNIEEEKQLMASRAKDLFMLRDEAIMKEDFDKIQEIELDFFKEFGIEMPVSQNESSGPIMAAEGGMMSVLPQGMEMDYRGGGFIPMGSKEKADDVPARVSKNEFVMTADAVRAAGGGSVNQGAKRMYELMNNLEARA